MKYMIKPFLLLLTSLTPLATYAASSQINNHKIIPDEPQKVTLCDIKNNQAAYNHKLVEVTGFISQGFEDSSIMDGGCNSRPGVWIEYGGKTATGTMYCCGVSAARQRSEPLLVEGIETFFEENEQFRTLDKLLHREPLHTR